MESLVIILKNITDPKVLNNINRIYETPKTGSALIFLPGYQEIMDARDIILERLGDTFIKIIMLHSTITASNNDI
jgi:HrpA-like RNA helicase